ncbi:penicillin-binding protein 1B [Marinibactrum halimedae]|uniref:Penicillin-binding protein 1B n=1 Tax=Marinibactrum halimedae TaxID=1444977 RepID=A0AA37T6G7_9GAMM|nr:penicillin-binding protein 1B [Marinibactrum halimedae]
MLLVSAVFFLVLDHVVREKFDGKKWQLAARVYARPLELYTGALVSVESLRAELNALTYRAVNNVRKPGHMSIRRNEVELFTRAHTVAGEQVQGHHVRIRFSGQQITDLRTVSNGGFLGNGVEEIDLLSLEPQEIGAIYPSSGEDRILVKLEDVPSLLGETLIAVEDRNFAHHFGLSPKSIARAFFANVKAGEVVQGGSTLTQQLVKNFYLSNERHIWRKVVEAFMTLSLEMHYSKADILETYINEVYLGQSGSRAIHGFALASQYYFRKPLQALGEEEIALLVGLVKGASYYNPWRNPERAKKRRNVVLGVMAETGLISQAGLEQLKSEPLGVVDKAESHHAYPAFMDVVKAQLRRDYQDDDLQSEGLQIYTTLAPSVQWNAEKSLSSRLESLESGYKIPSESLQAAAIITAVGSGEILAVVGDRNTRFEGFNRALNSQRPIGSLVKPAVYLAALESEDYTLASLISDGPIEVESKNGDIWAPQNFTRIDHGDVPLYKALSYSYNQATARLGMDVGMRQVVGVLDRLGLDRHVAPLPSVALGAVSLSPLEVSTLYHTLANDGVYTPLRAIRSVHRAGGERLKRYPLASQVRFHDTDVALIDYALQTTAHQGTAKSIYQVLPKNFAVAGKTGTTNEHRDSWFAGYTGNHLGVVWVGKDDNGKTPLTGATGALRIWRDIFSRLPTAPIDNHHRDIEFHWVDASTGAASAEHCRGAVMLPFKPGSAPTQSASCDFIKNPVKVWWRNLWGS